jgi:trigger factor
VKATWDKLEKNWMAFEFEVEAARFSQAIEAAFRKLNQKANIPGFRKGKAPRSMFERYYGKEALVQEAVEDFLPRIYAEAVTAHEIEPIDRPEIADIQSAEGQPFVVKGKVQVRPEVTLGRLSGFDLQRADDTVTPEQVEEQLQTLRERAARTVPDEGAELKEGGVAVIDFEGFLGDEPFEGGKGENYSLEIGSNSFIPGFEEQLVGAKAGEEREVRVTFPADYRAEHLAGKEALFKVTVKEVKRKELPELDDALAAEVSRFQTLKELQDDIENRLKESARRQADRELESAVIEAVVGEASVEIPEPLLENKVHDMIHDFEHRLQSQGFTLEQWHQATGKTHHDLHVEFDEPARKSVKTDLVLAALARTEGVTVSDAEVEAEFDRMVSLFRGREKEIQRLRSNENYRQRLREDLLTRKTIDHLVRLNQETGAR